MGNFEKLSVLVIVVIIVMILVVALYTWTDKPSDELASSKVGEPVTYGGAENEWRGRESNSPIVRSGGGEVQDVEKREPVDINDPHGLKNMLGGPPDEIDPIVEPPVGENPPVSDDPTVNEAWTHKVQKGETLGLIAQRELGTTKRLKEILALNPGLDPRRIQIGALLHMPARGAVDTPLVVADNSNSARGSSARGSSAQGSGSGPVPGETYVTQAGDTFESIATRAHGKKDRWPEIYAKNSEIIPDLGTLPAGTKIMIPR